MTAKEIKLDDIKNWDDYLVYVKDRKLVSNNTE